MLDYILPVWFMNKWADLKDWGRTQEQAEAKGCILNPHEKKCITYGCQAWHVKTHPLNFFIKPRGSCRIWPRGTPGVQGSSQWKGMNKAIQKH